jgi:hypothetical protein
MFQTVTLNVTGSSPGPQTAIFTEVYSCVPSGKFRGTASNYATTGYFHIPSNL